MGKFLFLIITTLLLSGSADAQYSRYIIKFKDKGTNPYAIANPSQFLSQRAIARKQRYNIPIDSADLPVTPRYLDSLRAAGNVTVLNTSKWLNQAAIKTSDAGALAKINAMPFVISSTPVAPFASEAPANTDKFGNTDIPSFLPETTTTENIVDYYNYGRSYGQVRIHKGEFLHNYGFRGEGMQMAMLDAGFFHYKTLPTFDSIRLNNQILGTWDFVANEVSVDEDDKHGMHCLSTVAANMPGLFIGTAPKTSFYLYRTEDVFSEYPVEEQNMAAGFEKADSSGADICSVSLGYYNFQDPAFDYTYNDLNGNITISARAADMASKKGMLMVIANGNEGTNSWHYLITPADADSVMSVGAVDTLGNVASFSSYGPSADGQVKPTLAAVGWNAVVANTSTGTPIFGNGTSFACPNLAGITTCLWQAFPEVNNMGIIEAMKQNASRSSNPNDRIGYGIPDVKRSFVYLIKELYTQSLATSGCNALLSLKVKAASGMSVSIERKLAAENIYSTIHTVNATGNFSLKEYNYTDDLSSDSGGVAAYRIRMDIGTDTTFYLDSLAADMSLSCTDTPAENIMAGPNPVISDLTLTVKHAVQSPYEIYLYNASGQKIYSAGGKTLAGVSTIIIPMKNLSSGIYFTVLMIDNKKVFTKEILKR